MKALVILTGTVLLTAGSVLAADRYVALDGGHTPPYTNWAMASTNLKVAVDTANAADAGETVWIAGDTYVLTAQVTVANTIVRGFSGDPSDVIVDGGGSVRCFYLNDANAVVQDITVSNGYMIAGNAVGAGVYVNVGSLRHCVLANNAVAADDRGGGGGAYCHLDGGLISNCVFVANHADPRGWGGVGGGLRMDNGLVVDCLFSNNVANWQGGGAYVTGGILTNCTLIGNATGTSGQGGGGVYVKEGVVANCLLRDNSSSFGGGAYLVGTNAILMNSTCVLNHAVTSGGGVQLTPGRMTGCVVSSNWTSRDIRWAGGGAFCGVAAGSLISNCQFIANHADPYGSTAVGGGLRMNNGLVVDCLFSNNVSYSHGGGLYLSGGAVSNCTFVGNSGGTTAGGAVYVTTGVVANCLLSGNTVNSLGGGAALAGDAVLINCLVKNNAGGGGVYAVGRGTLVNCTVVSNRASGATGGGFHCATATTGLVVNCIIYSNKSATAATDNWSLKDATSGLWAINTCTTPSLTDYGPGNITDDPKFEDAPGGNYRLASRSPCIDAGLTEPWMLAAVDLDGESRVTRAAVDMGAYESPPPGGTVVMIR